jgi:cell shape-determining protein MreC
MPEDDRKTRDELAAELEELRKENNQLVNKLRRIEQYAMQARQPRF